MVLCDCGLRLKRPSFKFPPPRFTHEAFVTRYGYRRYCLLNSVPWTQQGYRAGKCKRHCLERKTTNSRLTTRRRDSVVKPVRPAGQWGGQSGTQSADVFKWQCSGCERAIKGGKRCAWPRDYERWRACIAMEIYRSSNDNGNIKWIFHNGNNILHSSKWARSSKSAPPDM